METSTGSGAVQFESEWVVPLAEGQTPEQLAYLTAHHNRKKVKAVIGYFAPVIRKARGGSRGWVATNPALPGCIAQAKTTQELHAEWPEHLKSYLAGLAEMETPIPKPTHAAFQLDDVGSLFDVHQSANSARLALKLGMVLPFP
jgi:predicted RNase H-like HicB family nuclease